MKTREGWSVAGWYAACALLYVCAHPARDRPEAKSTAAGYTFESEISASELSESVEDSLEDFEETDSPTMRAIIMKKKSNVVLLPLIIEPEAEMLPAGYKGVKPPGVSHMEMTFTGPHISSSGRKSAASRNTDKSDGFDGHDDAHYAASRHETRVAKNGRSSEGLVILDGRSKGKKKKRKKIEYSEDSGSDSKTGSKKTEHSEGSKGDSKKENKKSEYSEASGAQKSRSESENRAKDHKEEVVEKENATYDTKDDRKKAHTASGYRNVYHKDEFKKDADFYDNGREGGRYEKHGRYGEKHSAAEDTYAKGKSNRSVREVEANERRRLEKTTGVD